MAKVQWPIKSAENGCKLLTRNVALSPTCSPLPHRHNAGSSFAAGVSGPFDETLDWNEAELLGPLRLFEHAIVSVRIDATTPATEKAALKGRRPLWVMIGLHLQESTDEDVLPRDAGSPVASVTSRGSSCTLPPVNSARSHLYQSALRLNGYFSCTKRALIRGRHMSSLPSEEKPIVSLAYWGYMQCARYRVFVTVAIRDE